MITESEWETLDRHEERLQRISEAAAEYHYINKWRSAMRSLFGEDPDIIPPKV